jgi:anion-transporting  ArsA/GET3 family ATPase
LLAAPALALARAHWQQGAPVTFRALADTASILVCCGSGGVGKTTVAAAIALEAAADGRRAVVVTIDPAKRLADALGLDGLSNEPVRLDAVAGPGGGELWAMMLDTRTTFDSLVKRHARDPDQAERILDNRFYRNIAGALSGTQEYMAAEKLYELDGDERFDLVVVDTPPTRNALDFLDAPGRLTRFLDHRLYRILMTPTRLGLKVMNVAAQIFLRTISRVVGGEVIADVIAFFQAFDGMEAGFRERAGSVIGLLHAESTRYVLVASARRDTIVEASFFADKLAHTGLSVAGVVVNRLHPRFGKETAADAVAAGEAAATAGDEALAELWANLAELRQVAEREADALEPLRSHVGEAPFAHVRLLATDVHDVDGLRSIAAQIFFSPR